MAKPEWGAKRQCQSCGARFYDMLRTPITCPKCDAAVEADVSFRPRRTKALAPVAAAATVAAVVAEPDEIADDEVEDIDGAEDESGLMEDASDLGEDDDDMAEVIEHMDENIEDEV